MKKLHDFLFPFTLAVILAGVILSFANSGRATPAKTNQCRLAFSDVAEAQTR
jgi:hypothetical protein